MTFLTFIENIITVPSKKRVEGDIYTVYRVASSGTLGITPLYLARGLKLSNRDKKIIVLLFLTSVYVKTINV